MALLTRFPILIWAGAALLGWIAGEMFVTDPVVVDYVGMEHAPAGATAEVIRQTGEHILHDYHYVAAVIGALIVLGIGSWYRRRKMAQAMAETHAA
jgi:predicted tellurium resistance membrane protein TerC